MRAAIYTGPGAVEITRRDDPRPGADDDVIIRVERCGICGSDLRALAVPHEMEYEPGVVIGHEFVGEVVHAAAGADVPLGSRVAVLPNLPCRRCHYCRTGRVNLCAGFTHLGAMRDGGAAELAAVPTGALHRIPDGLDWETAALAEPLACVLNGTRRARLHPGTPALILGAGPIGLLFLMVARLAGAGPILVSEPHEQRREWALRCGADIVCDPGAEALSEVIADATGGLGVEVAIDAVGSLLSDGISSVRSGGQVLVFGLNFRAHSSVSPAEIASRELSIEGVYIANGTFPLALDLLDAHAAAFRELITHRLPLEAFWHGIDAMRDGSGMKVMLEPANHEHHQEKTR
jgi:(R,R)-butanediol dehydrogenase / meso-butanediol dehydrogenase / diacetyl reductase